jgi:hypothetical protein
MEDKLKQRIQSIEKVLNNGNMSGKHYDSTKQPFFMRDGNQTEFKINFDYILDLPEGLNQNISLIYKIISDPDREIYLDNWTIMSLNKIKEIYKEYCNNHQTRVINIAFIYLGMGHINVMGCDLQTHNLFFHRDGGSNGYEREDNFNYMVKLDPETHQQYYFNDWFHNLDKQFIQ